MSRFAIDVPRLRGFNANAALGELSMWAFQSSTSISLIPTGSKAS
jgi:hypothetical protein